MFTQSDLIFCISICICHLEIIYANLVDKKQLLFKYASQAKQVKSFFLLLVPCKNNNLLYVYLHHHTIFMFSLPDNQKEILCHNMINCIVSNLYLMWNCHSPPVHSPKHASCIATWIKANVIFLTWMSLDWITFLRDMRIEGWYRRIITQLIHSTVSNTRTRTTNWKEIISYKRTMIGNYFTRVIHPLL